MKHKILILAIVILILISSIIVLSAEKSPEEILKALKGWVDKEMKDPDSFSSRQVSIMNVLDKKKIEPDAELKIALRTKHNEIKEKASKADDGSLRYLEVWNPKFELNQKEVRSLGTDKKKLEGLKRIDTDEEFNYLTEKQKAAYAGIKLTKGAIQWWHYLIFAVVIFAVLYGYNRFFSRKNLVKELFKLQAAILKLGRKEKNILTLISAVEKNKAKLIKENKDHSGKLEKELERVNTLNEKLKKTYIKNMENLEKNQDPSKPGKHLPLSLSGLTIFGLTEEEIKDMELIRRGDSPFRIHQLELVLDGIEKQNKELEELTKKELKLDDELAKELTAASENIKINTKSLTEVKEFIISNPKAVEGFRHIDNIQKATVKGLNKVGNEEILLSYKIIRHFQKTHQQFESFRIVINYENLRIDKEKKKVKLLKK